MWGVSGLQGLGGGGQGIAAAAAALSLVLVHENCYEIIVPYSLTSQSGKCSRCKTNWTALG